MDEPSSDVARSLPEAIEPELSRFMGTIAGTTAFELGELIAAEVRFWRFKRSVKHAQKTKAILDEAGMEPHAVPFRTLVPLLEKASLEDDEALTDRWAALLANAAGGQLEVPPSFPGVLGELEPVEAAMLDYIYDSAMTVAPVARRAVALSRDTLSNAFSLPEARVIYHTDNLFRLRLVGPGSDTVGEETRRVTLTEFGRAFVRACRPPSRPDPPITVPDAAALATIAAANEAQRREGQPTDTA